MTMIDPPVDHSGRKGVVLVGSDVRRIREALGWSQKDLAKILGLRSAGQKTVSAWETGQRIPGPVAIALLAIADGFRVSQSKSAQALRDDAGAGLIGSLQATFEDGDGHAAWREGRIRSLASQILEITAA